MKGTPTCLLCIYFLVGRKLVNMEEIWKDVKGYEGLYQVSNLGRVKSLEVKVPSGTKRGGKFFRTKKEKIMSKSLDKGYEFIRLSNNKITKNHRVHRLVAEAFIPNPNNYPCVNHKDENKLNNCVNNLEWCTTAYNNNYGTRLTKISKSLTNNPKISKKVNQYDKNGNFIKQWESMIEVERQLGIKNEHIGQCCRKVKKYKTAGGYIWKYAEEAENVKSGS